MPLLVPPQTDRPELLDLNRGSMAQARRSLRDLQRINAWLGGSRLALRGVFDLMEARGLQAATILDIGTGSADIPARLLRAASRRGVTLHVIGLDNNTRHLQVARAELAATRGLNLLQADAFRLPLADKSVDITVSTLFLHHFRPPQIVQLLCEFNRVSRTGVAINDLVRHYVPLVFMRLASPIFAHSYLTRHDGETSIRRGYTVAEMRAIAAASGLPGITVRGRFPYRMSITIAKP